MKYYKSFREVESKYNLGEITFFVENILENIINGQNSILELVEKTIEKAKYMDRVCKEIEEESTLKDLFELPHIIRNLQQFNVKGKKENVYGIDPYTTDIYNITLQYYLYGSAYARDSSVVNCIFYISFEKNSYTIEIEVMNDYLLKKSCPYSTFPDDESISVLPQQLGKKLLAKVKEV